MYTTGSSSFNQQPKLQINTPSLRVTMQEGLNCTGSNSFINGLSDGLDSLRQAFAFKDRLLVVRGSLSGVSGSIIPPVSSYQLNGLSSKIYHSDSTNPCLDIFVNGDTAVLYYNDYRTNIGASTVSIYCEFTSNGMTFGGSQGIIVGGSIEFDDLISVGDSQLYATSRIGYGNGVFPLSINNVQKDAIWSISNNGSWGATKIYSSDIYQSVDAVRQLVAQKWYSRKSILGTRIDNVDRIIHIGGKGHSGDGLHVIETDGINVFSDTEVIDQDLQLDRSINFGNFVGVSGIYYLPIILSDSRYIDSSFYTGILGNQYGLHLLQTKDFINWSLPTYIGGTGFYAYQGNINCGTVSGGSLGNLFSIFALDFGLDVFTQLDFNKSSNTTDISNDIVDYSNQNNERITITLGNYEQ